MSRPQVAITYPQLFLDNPMVERVLFPELAQRYLPRMVTLASRLQGGREYAEIVDGDADADLIHRGGDADRVRDLCASHEAGGGALAEAGAFGDTAQPSALRERDECRPQRNPPDFRGLELPETVIILNMT